MDIDTIDITHLTELGEIIVLTVNVIIIMILIVIFKRDHVLNLGNLIKTPVISVDIFHKKQECLIDSGASISIISKSCVPKS